MLAFFRIVLVLGFGALVGAAWVTIRARRRAAFGPRRPLVDDHVVRQIIEEGEVVIDDDDPLDLREIDDEEERFWSESWDEPGNDW